MPDQVGSKAPFEEKPNQPHVWPPIPQSEVSGRLLSFAGGHLSTTVDERNLHHLRISRRNEQWFQMVSKWCELDFVHPQYC